jgi:hypothetical protein
VNLVANSRLGIVNYNPRKIRRESGATRSLRTLWVPEEDTRILLASSRGHHTGGPKSTKPFNASQGPTLNNPHSCKQPPPQADETHTQTSHQQTSSHQLRCRYRHQPLPFSLLNALQHKYATTSTKALNIFATPPWQARQTLLRGLSPGFSEL